MDNVCFHIWMVVLYDGVTVEYDKRSLCDCMTAQYRQGTMALHEGPKTDVWPNCSYDDLILIPPLIPTSDMSQVYLGFLTWSIKYLLVNRC